MSIHCCYFQDFVKAACSALQQTSSLYIKLPKDITNPTPIQDIPDHNHC